MEKIKKLFNIKWPLVLYDAILYLASFILMFVINKSIKNMQIIDVFINSCVGFLIVFLCRFFGRIYNQIWRYGGIQCYIRLLCTDMLGMVLYLGFECGLCNLLGFQRFTISKIIAMMSFNTLLALGMRMCYRYCFKYGNELSAKGKLMRLLIRIFAFGMSIRKDGEAHKIYVAIVGAGNVGVSLAEELLNNKNTSYTPVCFFDTNKDKAGRDIYGIPVFQAKLNNTFDILKDYGVRFLLQRKIQQNFTIIIKNRIARLKYMIIRRFKLPVKSDSFVNLRLRICFSESRLRFQMKRLWVIMRIRSFLLRAAAVQ